MKSLKFGIIGCGLMGKEFAGAAMRWCHLNGDIPAPEIVGAANRSSEPLTWFKKIPTVKYFENDYRALLENPEVEAVYVAVPHNSHEQIYTDVLKAGKHLMGEKPFGIDKAANSAILEEVKRHPELFVRCASQLAFFPGAQRLINWFRQGCSGKILAVKAGFNHSSDLDVLKPINWKRQREVNGEYGVLGDLGMHTQFVPIRLGFDFKEVFAELSNIITERYDNSGDLVPCDTYDNAFLSCTAEYGGEKFPVYLETDRMRPGATNQWFIEIYGLNGSAKFTTDDPNAFYYTQQGGAEQAWCRLGIGNKPQFPTATGGIFEFGFSDAILQMWAAFMAEYSGMEVEFGCMKPEETARSHDIMTAGLKSHETGRKVEVKG